MADRVIGSFNMSSNYEVSIKKPLDARSLVPTYEALTIKENWITSTNKPIAYNGMLVAVANTADTTKNGLYFLFDPSCTSALKSPDVTVESNWIKIGETSEIGDFAERIAKIEADLGDFKDRLEAVEEKQNEVFAYRSLFPLEGVEGKLYIAIDEHKSYVWLSDLGFLCVGEENEEPSVIYGGDSGV